MKINVTLPFDHTFALQEFLTMDAVTEISQAAERAGFHGGNVTDHPAPTARWLDAGGHDAQDPFVMLSLIAAVNHPPTGRHAGSLFTLAAVILSAGAGLSVFGTAKTEALRREVESAREQVRQLGQYRLRKKLGQGGMGEVYLAEHQLLKRPCAIKRIHPRYLNNPEQVRRFEREVQSTAQLRHPNTVEIYDYGRAEDGTFYYVMEYLPGMSLEDMVARHGGNEWHAVRAMCRFNLAWTFAMQSDREHRPETLETEIQALRIGELTVVANSAEPFSAQALDVRNRLGMPHLMFVGYANGRIGYLPDAHDVAAKSYAAYQSPKYCNQFPFTVESGPAMCDAMVAAVRRLDSIAKR